MYIRLDRIHRATAVILGLVSLAVVTVLFLWNAAPQNFPFRAHDFLGASSLAMIAVAYLFYQAAHRPSVRELFKAVMLAAAFLFWAGNQLWPQSRHASLLNDIAVGLFVLDVFLVIIEWPRSTPDESFGETYTGSQEGNR